MLRGFAGLEGRRHESVGCAHSPPGLGSSSGPDDITLQHIRDLLVGSTDDSLQQTLVDFLNLMLAGSFDQEINSIIFCGRLIALSKKDGGIRPICVGYTLRRLAAKCANSFVIASGEARLFSHSSWVSASQVRLKQLFMQQEDLSVIYLVVTWSSN